MNPNRLRRPLGFLAALAGLLAIAPIIAEAPRPGTRLTQVAAIRQLTLDDATNQYPVQLRGVITFVDQPWQITFLQDNTGGVFLQGDGVSGKLQPGQWVEIEGRVGPGGFAPLVEVTRLSAGVPGQWPEAVQPEPGRLRSGQIDSLWIELHGVVQRVTENDGHVALKVRGRAVEFEAFFPSGFTADGAAAWLDADIRIRGVVATSFTEDAQLITFKLAVPGPDQVLIERPAPEDPWAAPLRMPNRLLGYHPGEPFDHRVRVRGTVTHTRPEGQIFLQDGANGLRVQLARGTLPRVGDRLEVLGFPAPGDYGPTLRHAETRALAPVPAPNPTPLELDRFHGGYHARLVTVRANLRSVYHRAGQTVFVLIDEKGDPFEARLDDGKSPTPGLPHNPESRMLLTGVYEAHSSDQLNVTGMTLWLRSAADIKVLEPGPWWNSSRALALAGWLAGACLLAAAWGAYLQRQVRRQSARLREQMQHELSLDRRYRELTDRAVDLIYTTDLAGNLLTWNRAVEELMPPNSANRPHNVLEAVAPEDQERVRERFRLRATSDADLPPMALAVIIPDGSRAVFETTTRTVRRPGEPPVIETVARDITKRWQAEDRLRQSEHRFRALFEHSPDAVFVISLSGEVLDANPAAGRLHGRAHAELIGRPFAELVSPERRDRLLERLGELAAGGRATLETSSQAAQGITVPVEIRASSVDRGDQPALLLHVRDVSERHRAAQALAESEERHRLLVENTHDLVVEMTPTGVLHYLSPNHRELLGYRAAPWNGRNVFRWIHPEDRAGVRESLAGPAHQATFRVRHASGTWNWFEATGRRYTSTNGDQRLVVVARDITERRRADRALREANGALLALARNEAIGSGDLDAAFREIALTARQGLQAARISLWLFNPDGSRLVCREVHEALPSGFQPGSELYLADHPAYFSALSRERFIAAHDARTDPRTASFTDSYLQPLGITSMLDAVIRSQGQVAGVICAEHTGPPHRWTEEEQVFAGSLADVVAITLQAHERCRAETALRRSNDQHRSVVSVLAEGVMVIEPGGRAVTFNESAQRILGLDARQLENRNVLEGWQTVTADGSPFLPENYPVAVTLRGGQPQSDVVMGVRRPDGSLVWISINSRPFGVGTDARVGGVVVSFADITSRRAAQDALRHARDELEQNVATRTAELQAANAQLSEFAYVVTHDLRAPLRGVSQLADWIAEDHAGQLGSEGTTMFRLLQARVQQMHQLIEGILAYTRIGRADALDAADAEVELNRLVGNVISLLSLPPTMQVTIPTPLPSVRGLPEPLHQVFQNLLDNAAKHHDKPAGRIEISAQRRVGAWEFRVCDDGPGIAPRYHEKIFQIFQQLQPRGAGKGTGIGLALVRRIVEYRGGRLWVESEEGQGATFAFTWPDRLPASPAVAVSRIGVQAETPGDAAGPPARSGLSGPATSV